MVGEKLLLVYDPMEGIDRYVNALDDLGYQVSIINAHRWWVTFRHSYLSEKDPDSQSSRLKSLNGDYFQAIVDRINFKGPYDALITSGEIGMSMKMRDSLEGNIEQIPLLLAHPVWGGDPKLKKSGFDLGSNGMMIDDFVKAAMSEQVPLIPNMVYNSECYMHVDGGLVRK